MVRILKKVGRAVLARSQVGKLDQQVQELTAHIEKKKGELEKARTQREVARKQRDEAREQRDLARAQRREAVEALRVAEKRAGHNSGRKRMNYLSQLHAAREEFDAFMQKHTDPSTASMAVRELSEGVQAPVFSHVFPQKLTPPTSVGFFTVANDAFLPGLEVLVASLLRTYPDFQSDFVVFHDGTISDFAQARVKRLYDRVVFREPDMDWLKAFPTDSGNRKRIGILGYMSVMALEFQEYERVIVMDSDTAVLDDISAFWTGVDQPLGTIDLRTAVEADTIFACNDHGARPWVAVSSGTGQPIINSGIISVPKRYLSAADFDEIKSLVGINQDTFCPLLDRFADQKAWNRFITKRSHKILPINFNCNIKFVDQHRGGNTSFARMVHFAGYKPWFSPDYMYKDEIPDTEGAAVLPEIWRSLAVDMLGRRRQQQYTREISRPDYFAPKPDAQQWQGKPMAMFIGNGPSLNKTDLSLIKGCESFAFNWFVHHPEFDEIRPDHLVLGSHMFFGGWQTRRPKMPDGYLDALREKQWKPTLWSSFYFREFFETTGLSDEFDIRYVLFEKPHKSFIDANGLPNLDASGFVQDGRTGVLSLALPVAYKMGYRQFGLVGCDSNYNQQDKAQSDGNYFYDKSKHTSLETRKESLTSTWQDGGIGFYAYTRQQEALELDGGTFVDFTIDGRLTLPKADLADLQRGSI